MADAGWRRNRDSTTRSRYTYTRNAAIGHPPRPGGNHRLALLARNPSSGRDARLAGGRVDLPWLQWRSESRTANVPLRRDGRSGPRRATRDRERANPTARARRLLARRQRPLKWL